MTGTQHGFEPRLCRAFKDECFLAIRKYCDDLEDRMKIELGRSAFPYMIADPLAILEEGEVHLGFSTAFIDEKSEFYETFLNNMDILVARNPAHLPSDIQKVCSSRCISKAMKLNHCRSEQCSSMNFRSTKML